MSFQKGHKHSSGRPKGSINKRSQEFADKLEAKGFDLAEALLELHREGMKTYRQGAFEHQMEGLKVANSAVKEIATYLLPKFQSISVSKDDTLENMTPQQKLEAMREAVKLMEAEQEKEVKKIDHSD